MITNPTKLDILKGLRLKMSGENKDYNEDFVGLKSWREFRKIFSEEIST